MSKINNAAITAIKSYHDWVETKSNLCHHEMVNALYQRFRGNYVIPKKLPIEYLKFHFKDNGTFLGVSILHNSSTPKSVCDSLEVEINQAIESLNTFYTLAPAKEIKTYEISSIINSIKNYPVCLPHSKTM
jgi:hypothetical protein